MRKWRKHLRLRLFVFGFVHTLAMAARPEQKPCMRAFVDELVALVGNEWATTIDQPFVIMGCMESTVIFGLRFYVEAGDEEPVVMRDGVIGRGLRWEVVARAMTPAKQEDGGPSSPSWEKRPTSENEDAVLHSLESIASDLDGNASIGRSSKRLTGTSPWKKSEQSADMAACARMIQIITTMRWMDSMDKGVDLWIYGISVKSLTLTIVDWWFGIVLT